MNQDSYFYFFKLANNLKTALQDYFCNMIKVLFIINKWADFKPDHGISNEQHNYVESLKSTYLAETECFYVDEHLIKYNKPYDKALITYCEKIQPHVIYVTLPRGLNFHVQPETLSRISESIGAKIIAVFPDTYTPNDSNRILKYYDFIDLILLQDSYAHVLQNLANKKKCFPIWTPQNPDYFFKGNDKKEIDVSFIGSVFRYPERKLAVTLCSRVIKNFIHRGGQDEDNLDIRDYSLLIRKSKISLNFSKPVFDEQGSQCKGRVFEIILSGSLLMEQKNIETQRWLTPDKDYVEWQNEKQLVEKIKYYLQNTRERQRISNSGYKKANEKYSAKIYWQTVFNYIGL